MHLVRCPVFPSSGVFGCALQSSGIVLCTLVNALKPNTVGKVKTPAANASRFAKLEALNAYKRGCASLGLTERDCLEPTSWLEGDASSMEALCEHLSALSRLFPKAPKFVPPGGLRKAPTKGGASKSSLGAVALRRLDPWTNSNSPSQQLERRSPILALSDPRSFASLGMVFDGYRRDDATGKTEKNSRAVSRSRGLAWSRSLENVPVSR